MTEQEKQLFEKLFAELEQIKARLSKLEKEKK